jgi:hypothetical protein
MIAADWRPSSPECSAAQWADGRNKTTIYLEPALLAATKTLAASRLAGEIKQRSSKRGKQPPPAIVNEHANPCFIGIRALPTPPIEPQTAFASRRSPVRSRLAP